MSQAFLQCHADLSRCNLGKKFDTQNKWITECIPTFSTSNPFTQCAVSSARSSTANAGTMIELRESVEPRRPYKAHAINFIRQRKICSAFEFTCIYHRSTNGSGFMRFTYASHKIINYRFFPLSLSPFIPISLASGSSYANGIINNVKIISIFIYLATLWFCTLRCDETMTANLFTKKTNNNKLTRIESFCGSGGSRGGYCWTRSETF